MTGSSTGSSETPDDEPVVWDEPHWSPTYSKTGPSVVSSVFSMAFGVLSAYGIFRIGFAVMRPQKRQPVGKTDVGYLVDLGCAFNVRINFIIFIFRHFAIPISQC